MNTCRFCGYIKEPVVFTSDKWKAIVWEDQFYLARCGITLNRHVEDLTKITEEEWKDLWKILNRLTSTIKKSFNPDMFNFAILGNVDKHVHMHVIPRYSSPREFGNEKFVDERFGSNYVPYPKKNMNAASLNEIASVLKLAIKGESLD